MRLLPITHRVLLFAGILVASAAGAQTKPALDPVPHPVHAVFMDGIAAFNAHDLDTFMQQWEEDIEMFTPTGWLRGRAAVRQRFVDTFRRFPRARMEIEELKVREVTPDVAVVDFRWNTYPGGTGPAFRGVGTGVYTRRAGRWVEVLEHESVVTVDAELRQAKP